MFTCHLTSCLGTKKQDIWQKIQRYSKKTTYFVNTMTDSLSKRSKTDNSIWIFYVKNQPNLSDILSIRNNSGGAHFLSNYFLITSIFETLFFLKSFFDKMSLIAFTKHNDFPRVCWILAKKSCFLRSRQLFNQSNDCTDLVNCSWSFNLRAHRWHLTASSSTSDH